MARMKDLLMDMEIYNELDKDGQKTIREIHNITEKDVEEILAVLKGAN